MDNILIHPLNIHKFGFDVNQTAMIGLFTLNPFIYIRRSWTSGGQKSK